MKRQSTPLGNETPDAFEPRFGRSAEGEGPASVIPLLGAGPAGEFDEGPVLLCRGYGVSFGAKVILAHVDLAAPRRGTTVLMGPAGTGKSTLLRSLAGFYANSELHKCWGETRYRGSALTATNRPALVTQRIELTQRSVRDSILFHVRRGWGATCADLEERMARWLSRLGAEQFIERFR